MRRVKYLLSSGDISQMANLRTGNFSNQSSDRQSYNYLINLSILMQLKQDNSFVYEERNQNFPQYTSTPRDNASGVGKILAKHQNSQNQPSAYMNYKPSVSRNLPVHSGTVLNYSQIYNDLIIDKSGNSEKQKPKPLQKKIEKLPERQLQKQSQKNMKEEEAQISKSPFHFQSAIEIGNKNFLTNKKSLPGIIIRTPKHSELSFQSKQIELEQSFAKPRVNKQFRISEIRDKNEKRINFQDVSDLSNVQAFNQNETQVELQIMNNMTALSNKNSQRTYLKKKPIHEQEKEQKKEQKIVEQRPLVNSRSIGVGNHRIDKKDLQTNLQNNSQINTPKVSPRGTPKAHEIKVSPRYKEQKYEQIQQIFQSKEDERKDSGPEKTMKVESKKKLQKQNQQQTHKPKYIEHNPQKIDNDSDKQIQKPENSNQVRNVKDINDIKSHVSIYDVKSNGSIYQTKNEQTFINQVKSNITKIQSKTNKSRDEEKAYSMVENGQINKDKLKYKKEKPGKIIHFQQKQDNLNKSSEKLEHSMKESRQQQTIQKSFIKQINSINKTKIQESQLQKSKQRVKDEHQINSIQVSRVASTIRPSKQQIHEENQVDLNINFEQGVDQIDNVLTDLNIKKISQPKQEQPQQFLEKSDYIATFNLEEYTKVYQVLKTIQNALKASVINVQQLLKSIKTYLQIIASGGLDNIEQFDIPLHKKKIIKNSLFFQRVSLIVLAFSYTTHSLKDSLKYLLNIMGYSINNCLILVKILEETQIQQQSQKIKAISPITNSVIQKSDRLAMKRNLDTLRNNNNVLLDSIQKLSKGEQGFYENLSQIIKLINKSSLEQTFYSLLEYFSFYLCVSQLDHMIPFLAVAPNPYLSPILSSGKYTLVIDVVQIFCYGTKKSKTNIFRPYTQHFLSQMSQYFQIISFVPMFPNQIDKIIDMLDPKGIISHRLYKHHTIKNNKQPLKYLDRIGRNLNEMILLDNESVGGVGSYENCLHIPTWKGNKNDTVLAELCPMLAMIALKKLSAVQACKKVREQSIRNKKQGVKYINFGITLD